MLIVKLAVRAFGRPDNYIIGSWEHLEMARSGRMLIKQWLKPTYDKHCVFRNHMLSKTLPLGESKGWHG